ncbi:PDZ domain-containing protein, partial [Azospirillum brasilense]|nr:PDZ domain-containing protein [Azospirillum brasilense]
MLAIGLGSLGGTLPRPAEAAATEAAFISEQVFAVAYGKIAEVYLQQVDFGRLGLDGLKGLATIDPTARSERQGNTVRLYVSGSLIGEYAAPSLSDAAGWAALTTKAVERARLYSPTLYQAVPERVYQVVLDAVMTDLDGYSRYTGTQRATSERAQREGYGGIGLSLEAANGRTLIRNVLPRSPADRAGIRSGDQLLPIDGDLTARLNESDMRDRLRGPTGTMVLLTVARDNNPPRRAPIRRERVVPNKGKAGGPDQDGVRKGDRFNTAIPPNMRDRGLSTRQSLGRTPAAR